MENIGKRHGFSSSRPLDDKAIDKSSKESLIKDGRLGKYQQEYKEWCSDHTDKSRDFYRKIQGSVSQHNLYPSNSLMMEEIVDPQIEEIDFNAEEKEMEGFFEIQKDNVPLNKEVLESLQKPMIKGSSVFSKIVSGVSYYFVPTVKTPNVNLEKTVPQQAFDLVDTLASLENSKPYQELLAKLPETFIKDKLIPLLNKLINFRDEKIILWKEGKSVPTGEIKKIGLAFKLDITELKKELNNNPLWEDMILRLSNLVDLLMEKVEVSNTQVLSDFSVLAIQSLESLKNLSEPKSRYYEGLQSQISLNEENPDPIISYLVKNNFLPRSEFVLQSFSWEMETGEQIGKERLFEKGYCKIVLAIPGQDLREIRIPIDFSSFKISSLNEERVIVSLLGKLAGASEEKRPDYLNKKQLRQELCSGCLLNYFPEKFEGLTFDNLRLFPQDKQSLLMVLSSVKSDIEKAIEKGITIKKLNTLESEGDFEEINLQETSEEMLTKEMREIIEQSLQHHLEENDLSNLYDRLKDPIMQRLISFDTEFNGLVDKYILNEGNYENIRKTLLFTCSYADEMIDKVNVTLGNKDVHVDNVVTLFDVFPKLVLEKLCANDENIKNKYEELLIGLHELRQDNIIFFFEGGEYKSDIEKQGKVSQLNTQLCMMISKAKLSKKEIQSVFDYLNYIMELSSANWFETTLTQPSSIREIVYHWSNNLDLPKDDQIKMGQMLSDPSLCRLVADYLHYCDVVEKKNIDLIKEGKTPNERMYHNRRLKNMGFTIIQEVLKSVEPLDKKFLVNAIIDKFKICVYGSMSDLDKKINVIRFEKRIEEEDLENLIDASKYWSKESDPMAAREHYRMAISKLNLNQLKELFVQQCLNLSSFKSSEKSIFESQLKNLIENIPQNKIEDFREMVVNFQSLIELRGEQLFNLNLGLDTFFQEDEISRVILNSGRDDPLLFRLLLPILENVSPMNTQLPYDNFYYYTYHPREVAIGVGDPRSFLNWIEGNQPSTLRTIINPSGGDFQMVKKNYVVRHTSNLFQKVTFHMEEGEIKREVYSEEYLKEIDLKTQNILPSRHPQSGFTEISFSLPTLGETRSCFIPLDLKPFNLKNEEAVLSLMTAIHSIATKEQKNRKEALLEILRNGENIGLTEETKDLFITTAFRYLEKVDEAMKKLLMCTGMPEIHFSDVEESGDLIPHQMLLDKCLENEKFKPILDKYFISLAKVRDQQLEGFIKGKDPSINPKDLSEIKISEANLIYWVAEIKISEANLIYWVADTKMTSGIFKNLEDQQLVVEYIKKMTKLVSEPLKNNKRMLREMNKCVINAAQLEKIDPQNEKLEFQKLQEILLPLLFDPNCMKLFNQFIRALKVSKEANSSLEDNDKGKKFQQRRIMDKLKKLNIIMEARVDLTNPQKENIVKCIDKMMS